MIAAAVFAALTACNKTLIESPVADSEYGYINFGLSSDLEIVDTKASATVTKNNSTYNVYLKQGTTDKWTSGDKNYKEYGDIAENDLKVPAGTYVIEAENYTETEADNRFVNVTGDTMTGTLTMSTGAAIQLWDDSATASHRLTLRNASDIGRIYNYTGSAYGAMYIGHDGTNAIVVTSGQAVGIGTGSPSGKLHVNGGLLNITANSGTLTIGSQNTSYTHYSTTGGTHWFNKAVEVNGTHSPHANNSFSSGKSSYRWSNVYSVLGNFTGAITSSLATSTHLKGNQGTAIINSTAAAGYNMLARMKSTNGVFTIGAYNAAFNLYYTADTTISAGTNSTTKGATLLDESGNSSFPGNITAVKFIKSGSSDSYVLLGGGGSKALSDFSMAHSHPYSSGGNASYSASVSAAGWV